MSSAHPVGAVSRLVFAALLVILGVNGAGAAEAGTAGAIDVVVDQATVVKLPDRIATLVVGNPLIADVSLQPGGAMVVTGKSYGSTNVMAMDRSGNVLLNRMVQVDGPTDGLVTVYRGLNRETYSCNPVCQRRITLGDGPDYFKGALEQSATLSNAATVPSLAATAANR